METRKVSFVPPQEGDVKAKHLSNGNANDPAKKLARARIILQELEQHLSTTTDPEASALIEEKITYLKQIIEPFSDPSLDNQLLELMGGSIKDINPVLLNNARSYLVVSEQIPPVHAVNISWRYKKKLALAKLQQLYEELDKANDLNTINELIEKIEDIWQDIYIIENAPEDIAAKLIELYNQQDKLAGKAKEQITAQIEKLQRAISELKDLEEHRKNPEYSNKIAKEKEKDLITLRKDIKSALEDFNQEKFLAIINDQNNGESAIAIKFEKEKFSILHLAVSNRFNIDTLAAILALTEGIDPRDINGRTPLHLAVQTNIDVVRFLLDNDADVNARTYSNVNLDNPAQHRWHIGNSDRMTNLLSARIRERISVTANSTPLHYALFNNANIDIIRLLLDRGAGINAADSERATPLHTAILYFYDLDIIRLLLSRGADVNVLDDLGYNPLFYAIAHLNYELITLLRVAGASLDTIYEDDQQPLLYYALGKDINLALFLIKIGANIALLKGTHLQMATKIIALINQGIDESDIYLIVNAQRNGYEISSSKYSDIKEAIREQLSLQDMAISTDFDDLEFCNEDVTFAFNDSLQNIANQLGVTINIYSLSTHDIITPNAAADYRGEINLFYTSSDTGNQYYSLTGFNGNFRSSLASFVSMDSQENLNNFIENFNSAGNEGTIAKAKENGYEINLTKNGDIREAIKAQLNLLGIEIAADLDDLEISNERMYLDFKGVLQNTANQLNVRINVYSLLSHDVFTPNAAGDFSDVNLFYTNNARDQYHSIMGFNSNFRSHTFLDDDVGLYMDYDDIEPSKAEITHMRAQQPPANYSYPESANMGFYAEVNLSPYEKYNAERPFPPFEFVFHGAEPTLPLCGCNFCFAAVAGSSSNI